MKKRNKRILYIVMATIVLAFAIVPSFAANDVTVIVTVNNNNASYSRYYSFTGDITNIQYSYDSSTDLLNITITTNQLENEVVYYAVIPNNTAYVLETEHSEGTDGEYTYTVRDTNYTHNITIPSDTLYIEINVSIVSGGNTYEQGYEAGLTAGITQGIETVQRAPWNYDLYTEAQYLSYGRSEFNRGYNSGIAGAITQQQYEAYGQQKYADGLERGHKDAKTLVGIANVGMTGIVTTFQQFVNNAGVWGITLASVIVTGIIVLIVYFVFKAVRG